MKTEWEQGMRPSELQFELKYCERCGGLGVRPMDDKQIYCAPCGREIAELPPISYGADDEGWPGDLEWMADESDWVEDHEIGILGLDAGVWHE